MKDFDINRMPKLDDDSKENFEKANALLDYLYEKAKKEKEEKEEKHPE